MTRPPLAPATMSASGRAGHRWPVGVGPRGFLLLAVGLLWIVPAWIDRRTLIAMVLWDLLVAAAWLIDLRRLPPPTRLHATRAWGGPLGLDMPEHVTLTLRHYGPVPIDAHVTDFAAPELFLRTHGEASASASTSASASAPGLHPESTPFAAPTSPAPRTPGMPPRDLQARDLPVRRLRVVPDDEARAAYEIEPRVRGDLAMGDVLVRYQSAWGIATRWAIVPLAQSVRVYPNLREARQQALALVRSRQIVVEKRRARERAAGRDFESLREYQDGDEPRDICWTASARRGKLVTKVYQPERSQTVWMLVDAGRLLRAQVARHTRLDYGVNSALALAQVALASGDRVGLIAYGRRPQQRVAPGRGASHLRALVEALAAVRAEAVEADHTAAASAVLSVQKRRSLIVWLTEVAETAGVPEVIESSQRMAPRHVVLLAVTRQPELTALAHARPADQAAMYRVMAAQQTLERRETLLHGLRQRGVQTMEMMPGELSAGLVERYLTIKARNLL